MMSGFLTTERVIFASFNKCILKSVLNHNDVAIATSFFARFQVFGMETTAVARSPQILKQDGATDEHDR